MAILDEATAVSKQSIVDRFADYVKATANAGISWGNNNPPPQVYTAPGFYSWNVPSGITSIRVLIVGAGGGGGGQFFDGSVGSGGGGGGSGGFRRETIAVSPGQLINIGVGGGGVGSGYNSLAQGGTGGGSYVDSFTVGGGTGGTCAYYPPGQGGIGGSPSGVNGAAGGFGSFSGGAGGNNGTGYGSGGNGGGNSAGGTGANGYVQIDMGDGSGVSSYPFAEFSHGSIFGGPTSGKVLQISGSNIVGTDLDEIQAQSIYDVLIEETARYTKIRNMRAILFVDGAGGNTGSRPTPGVVFDQTAVAHMNDSYLQGPVSATREDVFSGNKITAGGLEVMFSNMRAAYNEKRAISAGTWQTNVCHASCHSSCHGSRGRR